MDVEGKWNRFVRITIDSKLTQEAILLWVVIMVVTYILFYPKKRR
jgi:hypothetical protein|tara:strand:- start:2414 stop:2548 length:135 start_codon:yes stop_codon:yes gene_type:complete